MFVSSPIKRRNSEDTSSLDAGGWEGPASAKDGEEATTVGGEGGGGGTPDDGPACGPGGVGGPVEEWLADEEWGGDVMREPGPNTKSLRDSSLQKGGTPFRFAERFTASHDFFRDVNWWDSRSTRPTVLRNFTFSGHTTQTSGLNPKSLETHVR